MITSPQGDILGTKKGRCEVARMNGSLWLTERQVKTLWKGDNIVLKREGKEIILGVKSRVQKRNQILKQILDLKGRLKELGGEKRKPWGQKGVQKELWNEPNSKQVRKSK